MWHLAWPSSAPSWLLGSYPLRTGSSSLWAGTRSSGCTANTSGSSAHSGWPSGGIQMLCAPPSDTGKRTAWRQRPTRLAPARGWWKLPGHQRGWTPEPYQEFRLLSLSPSHYHSCWGPQGLPGEILSRSMSSGLLWEESKFILTNYKCIASYHGNLQLTWLSWWLPLLLTWILFATGRGLCVQGVREKEVLVAMYVMIFANHRHIKRTVIIRKNPSMLFQVGENGSGKTALVN